MYPEELNDNPAASDPIKIAEDKEEGTFVVFYSDLPGCSICGETIYAHFSGSVCVGDDMCTSMKKFVLIAVNA